MTDALDTEHMRTVFDVMGRADTLKLAFLQCQVLVRVGEERMDADDEERAGIHIERDGSSGVHLPARLAGDMANNAAIRVYVAGELRRVAALLEARSLHALAP